METVIRHARRLRGTVRVPGDKSIAHRALLLGALAEEPQVIEGLPEAGDVSRTAACLRALSCRVERDREGRTIVQGPVASGGQVLYAGNSGTTARLLAGVIAGRGLEATLDGDASLRRRPMLRIASPLRLMGAEIETTCGSLPMRIRGRTLRPISYRLPVASAQVKSAILIAALHAEGTTTVTEPAPSRDHTENMLAAMGAPITRANGGVALAGPARLHGGRVRVPADFSSAAFWIAAAASHPDAEIHLPDVGMNPTRTGMLEVLAAMGATVTLERQATESGEPRADLQVRSAALRGVEISGAIVPRLIDELPVLAVVASQARGITKVSGAEELRHKECDRISATVECLRVLGGQIEECADGFVVEGPCALRGGAVSSRGDHRIAMAMAVAGLLAEGSTTIVESEIAGISYPGFFADLAVLAE
jgi:3-phosphoshikimate 1-carboxyvinyltransferase